MEKRITSDTIYIRNIASNNSSEKVVHKNIEDTNNFFLKVECNIVINLSINVMSLNDNRGHNIILVGVDLRVLVYGAHLFLN